MENKSIGFDAPYTVRSSRTSLDRYRAVVYTANNEVDLPGASNAKDFAGITLTSAAGGEQILVRKGGIALCKVSAAVTRGRRAYMSNSSGYLDDLPESATGTTYHAIGFFEYAGAANEDVVPVWVAPHQADS